MWRHHGPTYERSKAQSFSSLASCLDRYHLRFSSKFDAFGTRLLAWFFQLWLDAASESNSAPPSTASDRACASHWVRGSSGLSPPWFVEFSSCGPPPVRPCCFSRQDGTRPFANLRAAFTLASSASQLRFQICAALLQLALHRTPTSSVIRGVRSTGQLQSFSAILAQPAVSPLQPHTSAATQTTPSFTWLAAPFSQTQCESSKAVALRSASPGLFALPLQVVSAQLLIWLALAIPREFASAPSLFSPFLTFAFRPRTPAAQLFALSTR